MKDTTVIAAIVAAVASVCVAVITTRTHNAVRSPKGEPAIGTGVARTHGLLRRKIRTDIALEDRHRDLHAEDDGHDEILTDYIEDSRKLLDEDDRASGLDD